jgi:prepilin-type N-terminal cleavage/methylation domain-containing protein
MTRPSSSPGFTLVEVMIAIGIMTVGSLGILSMHQAVTRANRDAREMNTALAITETWIERVERDALLWTAEGINTTQLQSTAYLDEIAGVADETNWFTPVPTDTSESWAFDFFGNDTRTSADIKYCVNLKLSWLRQGSSVRVDVRTFWLREGHMIGSPTHTKWVNASDFRGADCAAATADGWGLGSGTDVVPNVNAMFASTVVTWLRRDAP